LILGILIETLHTLLIYIPLIISLSFAMTNVFFKYVLKLVIDNRLKGKWSTRRREGFHSTLSVSSFVATPHHSSIGIIFSLIFTCTNGGESKGLSNVSVFGD
jgi:hypothetical protein